MTKTKRSKDKTKPTDKKSKTETDPSQEDGQDDFFEEKKSPSPSRTVETDHSEETKTGSGAKEPEGGHSGLKRQGSRHDLQANEDAPDRYRPEFSYKKADEQESHTEKQEKIWDLMKTYSGTDQRSIQRSIVNHVEYTLARTRFNFDNFGAYQAAACSVRDRLIEAWNDTDAYHSTQDSKHVYYLSLEFLMGRHLQNMLVNIDMEEQYKTALNDLGYELEDIYEEEVDAGLGNGGLGRLAACFLDSMATLELPAWGYGIRYDYGIFKQLIQDGKQVEIPDFWLKQGNPWEIERADISYAVRFFG